MGHTFCTLFDRDFLFRGLALYESLETTARDFTLWILCMDDTCYDVLDRMSLPKARLIRLADFEDADLLAAKATRNPLEYCWTCTPSLPLWLLETYPELDSVTYLDADLMFFSDPEPLFDELGDGSVAIVEHRFSSRWAHLSDQSGIYNVEFLIFRNDERGLRVLRWWRDRCLEWCYDRVEDGKLADQMYLNDWPTRFAGVVVLRHPGAGLAPWNVDRYEISDEGGAVTVDGADLVFYHYSSFSIIDEGSLTFLPAYPEYRIPESDRRMLYGPYIAAINRAIDSTRVVVPGYSYGIQKVSRQETARRLRADRRARLIRAAGRIPLLHLLLDAARRATGRGVGELPAPPVATPDTKESWRSDDVAAQQQKLVLSELRDPEQVTPFRVFLDIARAILDFSPADETLTFLDVGCGVGHYSEVLRVYVPGRFDYTGSDYSEAMIERARALWPDTRFVVDDVFHSDLDMRSYDVIMAAALVDVLEDFWTALDLLFSNTSRLLILHRQQLTKRPSYSEPALGYEGQVTFSTYLNRRELDERLAGHGLRVRRTFALGHGVYSLLIEKVASPAADARVD